MSNIPFMGVGAVGLWQFGRSPATMLLFLGIFLTGFGSAYYHLEPNDQTLFWDRLPMAISFMAILAIAIEERVDSRAGAIHRQRHPHRRSRGENLYRTGALRKPDYCTSLARRRAAEFTV